MLSIVIPSGEPSFLENFKNLDQIAKAKEEIINNIMPGGTMVINMDDKYYNALSVDIMKSS